MLLPAVTIEAENLFHLRTARATFSALRSATWMFVR